MYNTECSLGTVSMYFHVIPQFNKDCIIMQQLASWSMKSWLGNANDTEMLKIKSKLRLNDTCYYEKPFQLLGIRGGRGGLHYDRCPREQLWACKSTTPAYLAEVYLICVPLNTLLYNHHQRKFFIAYPYNMWSNLVQFSHYKMGIMPQMLLWD